LQPPRKVTIVVAENSEPLRYAIRRFLEMHDFRVFEAIDGAQALALVTDHMGPVDLVVADYRMPRMDGFELSKRLKAERPEIPVLFVSAWAEDFRESHPEVMSVQLMQKPVEMDALLARIRELIHPQ
jgi:two-component system, cell cycle sensor histidine kinase and response regulator CckA